MGLGRIGHLMGSRTNRCRRRGVSYVLQPAEFEHLAIEIRLLPQSRRVTAAQRGL